jgi:hypothetical protein
MRSMRMPAALMAAMLAAVMAPCASQAGAQESGTLFFQSATIKTDGTVPAARFKVASGRGTPEAPWTANLYVEIGREGNAATPPADPGLPAGLTFRVRRLDVVGINYTFPLAGGTNETDTDKWIYVSRGLSDVAPTAQGLYQVQILFNARTTVQERWEVVLENLPGTWRVNFFITGGFLDDVDPTPAACAGSSTTCPAGQACRAPCNCGFPPIKKCYGAFRMCEGEFGIPRIPDGCPYGLSCPDEWRVPFDLSLFDRVVTTFVPTDSQRMLLQRNKDIMFAVEGGDRIGGVLEGNGGEFMQMVQFPKGKPPMVTVASGGVTFAQVRVEPPSKARPESPARSLLYGLGGLILGALGTALGMRRGTPPGPGQNRIP